MTHTDSRWPALLLVAAGALLLTACASPADNSDAGFLDGDAGTHWYADHQHDHDHGHHHHYADHAHSHDGQIEVAQPGPGGPPPGGPGGPGMGGGPPMRRHTVTQSDGELDLVPANQRAGRPSVEITTSDEWRVIRVNGIPKHQVGRFPNPGNPNAIRAQSYRFRVTMKPQRRERPTAGGMNVFGVGVNGVPFDPGAGEFYQGNRNSGWQYEPLSGAIDLGLDTNYSHVQPGGAYHYHGLPTGLLRELGVEAGKHSPLIGWAADGFPIYARYGYRDPNDPDSDIVELKSSYKVKSGRRPNGANDPGGRYDGTFVADYEYKKDSGDLNECNARWTKTPEFPDGTWAYFLTNDWPVIPRYYLGTPDSSFRKGPPNRRR